MDLDVHFPPHIWGYGVIFFFNKFSDSLSLSALSESPIMHTLVSFMMSHKTFFCLFFYSFFLVLLQSNFKLPVFKLSDFFCPAWLSLLLKLSEFFTSSHCVLQLQNFCFS